VHATRQTTQQGPFSKVELRAHALAGRQAKKQLLQIPWNRFRKAYEEYPQWQGLSLWIRAVVTAEGHASTEVLKTLRERCPGFLESEESMREPSLLAFHLLEWVHSRMFGHAKREGWLDALTFYGVRHLRSQAVWAFWEHCENEWSRVSPKAVPSFEEWRLRALETKICGEVTYSDMALAVENYIDWEATAQWVRPLLADGIRLPAHVVTELQRRLSRACYHPRPTSKENDERRSINWRSVVGAAKQRFLRDAKLEGCLDGFMEWVRSHPRQVRLMVCGKLWTKEQPEKRVRYYPSFREWNQTADQYMEAKPKRISKA
jgi:hypothetical protein